MAINATGQTTKERNESKPLPSTKVNCNQVLFQKRSTIVYISETLLQLSGDRLRKTSNSQCDRIVQRLPNLDIHARYHL